MSSYSDFLKSILLNQIDKYPCLSYDAPCFDEQLRHADLYLGQKTMATDARHSDECLYSQDIAASLKH